MSHPRLGERVFYTLSADDAEEINRLRREAGMPATLAGKVPYKGDQLPAVLVKDAGNRAWNLQVALDGADTYWVAGRAEGQGPGTWQTRPSL